MSQFEYVSVAVALIYSVGVARLLTALPDVFERGRRYWIHAAWVVYLLLFSALSWWSFFSFSEGFEFQPITFLLALCPPSFVVVRAQILCGRPSLEISSYRDHFYQKRVPFFAVGLASMTLLFLTPWISGAIEFGEIRPVHLRGLPFLLVWIVGILSSRPAVRISIIGAWRLRAAT